MANNKSECFATLSDLNSSNIDVDNAANNNAHFGTENSDNGKLGHTRNASALMTTTASATTTKRPVNTMDTDGLLALSTSPPSPLKLGQVGPHHRQQKHYHYGRRSYRRVQDTEESEGAFDEDDLSEPESLEALETRTIFAVVRHQESRGRQRGMLGQIAAHLAKNSRTAPSDDNVAGTIATSNSATPSSSNKQLPTGTGQQQEIRCALAGVTVQEYQYYKEMMKIIKDYQNGCRDMFDMLDNAQHYRRLGESITRMLDLFHCICHSFNYSKEYLYYISEIMAIYLSCELKFAKDLGQSAPVTLIGNRISQIMERYLFVPSDDLETHRNNLLHVYVAAPRTFRQRELWYKLMNGFLPQSRPCQQEFPDKVYVQYIIIFYRWLDLESDPEERLRLVAYAEQFMRPAKTLACNPSYAYLLPRYEDRKRATGYILQNLKFYRDLRNAVIFDNCLKALAVGVDLTHDEDYLANYQRKVDLVKMMLSPRRDNDDEANSSVTTSAGLETTSANLVASLKRELPTIVQEKGVPTSDEQEESEMDPTQIPLNSRFPRALRTYGKKKKQRRDQQLEQEQGEDGGTAPTTNSNSINVATTSSVSTTSLPSSSVQATRPIATSAVQSTPRQGRDCGRAEPLAPQQYVIPYIGSRLGTPCAPTLPLPPCSPYRIPRGHSMPFAGHFGIEDYDDDEMYHDPRADEYLLGLNRNNPFLTGQSQEHEPPHVPALASPPTQRRVQFNDVPLGPTGAAPPAGEGMPTPTATATSTSPSPSPPPLPPSPPRTNSRMPARKHSQASTTALMTAGYHQRFSSPSKSACEVSSGPSTASTAAAASSSLNPPSDTIKNMVRKENIDAIPTLFSVHSRYLEERGDSQTNGDTAVASTSSRTDNQASRSGSLKHRKNNNYKNSSDSAQMEMPQFQTKRRSHSASSKHYPDGQDAEQDEPQQTEESEALYKKLLKREKSAKRSLIPKPDGSGSKTTQSFQSVRFEQKQRADGEEDRQQLYALKKPCCPLGSSSQKSASEDEDDDAEEVEEKEKNEPKEASNDVGGAENSSQEGAEAAGTTTKLSPKTEPKSVMKSFKLHYRHPVLKPKKKKSRVTFASGSSSPDGKVSSVDAATVAPTSTKLPECEEQVAIPSGDKADDQPCSDSLTIASIKSSIQTQLLALAEEERREDREHDRETKLKAAALVENNPRDGNDKESPGECQPNKAGFEKVENEEDDSSWEEVEQLGESIYRTTSKKASRWSSKKKFKMAVPLKHKMKNSSPKSVQKKAGSTGPEEAKQALPAATTTSSLALLANTAAVTKRLDACRAEAGEEKADKADIMEPNETSVKSQDATCSLLPISGGETKVAKCNDEISADYHLPPIGSIVTYGVELTVEATPTVPAYLFNGESRDLPTPPLMTTNAGLPTAASNDDEPNEDARVGRDALGREEVESAANNSTSKVCNSPTDYEVSSTQEERQTEATKSRRLPLATEGGKNKESNGAVANDVIELQLQNNQVDTTNDQMEVLASNKSGGGRDRASFMSRSSSSNDGVDPIDFITKVPKSIVLPATSTLVDGGMGLVGSYAKEEATTSKSTKLRVGEGNKPTGDGRPRARNGSGHNSPRQSKRSVPKNDKKKPSNNKGKNDKHGSHGGHGKNASGVDGNTNCE